MAAQRRQVAAEGQQNHHPAQAAMREAEARVAHYFLLRAGGGGALTARVSGEQDDGMLRRVARKTTEWPTLLVCMCFVSRVSFVTGICVGKMCHACIRSGGT